eukprot:EG_transcript_3226
MRLGVIFVITLAVSVIVSSTATWGLTYSTSYDELHNMATGFVGLTTVAVNDFAQLVLQLISDSGTLVSGILDTEYQRSMSQLNETGQQFLQTTLQLMSSARNTTAQTQGLVVALVLSFGNFMGKVIGDFTGVGTAYASQLRMEAASRTQTTFYNLLQGRILTIQRQARLYELGLLNLSVRADQPMDDGSCTLLGSLCAASAEIHNDIYIATEEGSMMLCDVSEVAYTLTVQRGVTEDTYRWANWPPFLSNFSQWKGACLAGPNATDLISVCRPGDAAMAWPSCNGTCGYDPRCRPWYVHDPSSSPRTHMSAVYLDLHQFVPVVTLIYPIYSSVLGRQVGIAATDFYFSALDAFLATLGSGSVSQRVAVVFNSSDLLVVGSNRPCPNVTQQNSGVGIAHVCDPVLQELGGWLAAHQDLVGNASLELAGMLWDVFPGTVDSFSYFVAVGMNKTEVYAVITTASQEANDTLQNMSHQQSVRMAALQAVALAEMDAVSAQRVAELQALQAAEERHAALLQNETAVELDASRQKSAQNLNLLIANVMGSIQSLESYHLDRVARSVGRTFGAVVGVFAGILLCGAYGTWAVSRQVQRIAQVMEDVAHMRVEELVVSQKSSIREVQRIEAALGVLVGRLAEYKSYMPAGLFQLASNPDLTAVESCLSPRILVQAAQKHGSVAGSTSYSRSTMSHSTSSRTPSVHAAPLAGATRLLRRYVVAMAVNVVRFQGELAQRSAAHLEGMLNRLVSAVHGLASKAQGNLDAIVGDQLMVTFNAHFSCSDPPAAAANVALDLVGLMEADSAFAGRVQVGLAAGSVYVGALGYTAFKAMVALGPPLKVAALLSH